MKKGKGRQATKNDVVSKLKGNNKLAKNIVQIEAAVLEQISDLQDKQLEMGHRIVDELIRLRKAGRTGKVQAENSPFPVVERKWNDEEESWENKYRSEKTISVIVYTIAEYLFKEMFLNCICFILTFEKLKLFRT
ncbi:hypothetical protein QAD02_013630 [Eretmocerus hayati]|uniref:Uncharacterized protein n=1 Tax=Eretmocerus hayati TaxID=131215 RepID=A0ACC2P2Z8_9HYME|nr:hypothetical protein QAD02_013630 [Eretmocerus hayati]